MRTLTDLSSAIDTVIDDIGELEPKDQYPWGKRHFGLWYRGQPNSNHGLTPSVMRHHPGPTWFFDETAIFHHFQSLNPTIPLDRYEIFDWLCMMQHHSVPTRLLDWTENLLVALYFAVQEEQQTDADGKQTSADGALFVLNARRLNAATSLANSDPDVRIIDSFDVLLRSMLVLETNLPAVIDRVRRCPQRARIEDAQRKQEFLLAQLDRLYEAVRSNSSDSEVSLIRDKLACPVAVLPARRNPRMIAQASVLTLHGGRVAPPWGGERNSLPAPTDITAIPPKDGPIIEKFRIAAGSKAKIKARLERIGIEESTLFPELEHQSGGLRDRWRWEHS